MANRLANETSPYLLQHKDNPVDWYPWGEEALERARNEDRPILLSVGYSACHWCHVMERESFEDEATAQIMNEHFVNIKVDREERPDIDSIYMSAVQALTRGGGWPMTVFLTPDGAPFYGGTYFPPRPRGGLPSFQQVLLSLADAYENNRDEVMKSAEGVREYLKAATGAAIPRSALGTGLLDNAAASLSGELDRRFGGFGGAPKFPQAMNLEVLLRHHRTGDRDALSGVEVTLRAMANGGIYDQLGGGFARYSVDRYWLVPHFEKMLYDNALLGRLYLEAYQATGDSFYRRIAEETLDYVVRDMTSPEEASTPPRTPTRGRGGQVLRVDAGGDPGRPRPRGRRPRGALLGRYRTGQLRGQEHSPRAATAGGGRRGVRLSPEELWERVEGIRSRLFAAREERVRPGRDEKVLASWNGLMLHSFAFAASVLDREDYREVAERNAAFLLEKLRVDGRLKRSYKDGQPASTATSRTTRWSPTV